MIPKLNWKAVNHEARWKCGSMPLWKGPKRDTRQTHTILSIHKLLGVFPYTPGIRGISQIHVQHDSQNGGMETTPKNVASFWGVIFFGGVSSWYKASWDNHVFYPVHKNSEISLLIGSTSQFIQLRSKLLGLSSSSVEFEPGPFGIDLMIQPPTHTHKQMSDWGS